MYRLSHNKVTTSRFSVVNIDGCPLGTVYIVHHYNAKLHSHSKGRVLVFGSP